MDKHKSIPFNGWVNFKCHACGHESRQRVKSIVKPPFIQFSCPICTTRATITFDTGQDKLERYFRLAEDLEDNWF